MTRALHQALIDGRSFSRALSEFPRIFPPLYVNMVAAGEASGRAAADSASAGQTFDAGEDLRDRVQQALIYPAFLALAGAILITIFITFNGTATDRIQCRKPAVRCHCPRASYCTFIMQSRDTGGSGRCSRLLPVMGSARLSALMKDESHGTGFVSSFPVTGVSSGTLLRAVSRTLGTLMENGIPCFAPSIL